MALNARLMGLVFMGPDQQKDTWHACSVFMDGSDHTY